MYSKLTTSNPCRDNAHSVEIIKKDVILIVNGSRLTLYNAVCPTDLVAEPLPQSDPIPSLDVQAYEKRLSTFAGWPLDFLTPEQMAKAGFYYTGIEDKVRCYYCSSALAQWEEGDDPLAGHKKFSPNCYFFSKTVAYDYDICGFYSYDDIHFTVEKKYLEDYINSLGIIHPIGYALHLPNVTLESRLKTFNRCEARLKQDIRQLCEAGFCYLGDGNNDVVNCFYCDKRLKEWQDHDDVWIEHARFSPDCSYVLLSKGKDFVEKACLLNINVHNNIQEDPSMPITDDNNASIPEDLVDDNNASIPEDLVDDNNASIPEDLVDDNNASIPEDLVDDNNASIPEDLVDDNNASIPEDLVDDNNASIPEDLVDDNNASIPEDSVDDKIVTKREIDQAVTTDNNQVNTSLSEMNLCNSQQQYPSTLTDSMMCRICLQDKLKIAFIPCGHIYTCVQCAVSLGHCAVCRSHCKQAMRIFVHMDELNDQSFNQSPVTSSQISNGLSDPMICKICRKKDMKAVFIPCRHVYTCEDCAAEMDECPVCAESICGNMHVFF